MFECAKVCVCECMRETREMCVCERVRVNEKGVCVSGRDRQGGREGRRERERKKEGRKKTDQGQVLM